MKATTHIGPLRTLAESIIAEVVNLTGKKVESHYDTISNRIIVQTRGISALSASGWDWNEAALKIDHKLSIDHCMDLAFRREYEREYGCLDEGLQ